MNKPVKCCARFSSTNLYGRYYSCVNKAKMTHEGKHYCGIHDPVKQKAKAEKTLQKYREKSAVDDAVLQLKNAAPEMLAVLKIVEERALLLLIFKSKDNSKEEDEMEMVGIDKTMDKIRNAIKKAEGK